MLAAEWRLAGSWERLLVTSKAQEALDPSGYEPDRYFQVYFHGENKRAGAA